MGGVEARWTAICTSPPTQVYSSNGSGESRYSTKPLPHSCCQRESKIPNSSRLSEHQGAAQDSKLLPAEASWRGRAAQHQDPEPSPAWQGHISGAPWTAASLVTCRYCYLSSETTGKGRPGQGMGTAVKLLARTLAHVSVRSHTGGTVAP